MVPIEMTATVSKTIPYERLLIALAYACLVAAFIVGQIASKTDYDDLLRRAKPDVKLVQSLANAELPIVYLIEDDAKGNANVAVMSEGEGYSGPLVIAIKSERTDSGARINEIIVLSHKETPSFMALIKKKGFFRQFAGKDVSSNFIVGDDIDAVSGASVSSVGFTAAIREAVHLGAVNHLKITPTWQEPELNVGINEAILVLLFMIALFAAYNQGKRAKYARYFVMAGALVFVGIYTNSSVSLGSLAGIILGYIPPFTQHPLWWIMMGGVLGSVILLGRNVYCQYLCPFSIVADILQKISGVRLKIKPAVQRHARVLIFSLSWAALMLIFLSAHPAMGSYEPFALLFSLEGLGVQWYILPAALIGSFFIPSFWCRLFCPVGLYLNEIVRVRRSLKNRIFGKKIDKKPETTNEPKD